MTAFLPPNLLALFAPRDPIPYLPPVTKLNHEKKTHGYFGVGQYLHLFEDPKDTPPPVKIETREERLERKQREKLERAAYIREQGIALWDPNNNENATNDPYKTLFVARINADTSESRLRKEFEVYGPIKKVMLIQDKISGKPRGYAFIEFENERDMHSAYKHADGRRVLVDVERGRTVKGWLPRRLGGGLGDSRSTKSSSGFRNGGEDRDEKYVIFEDERENNLFFFYSFY
ncbi:U1 small nuclear ribonucleoprotein 70 kDa-like protein, partial [Euroglyphus maynei]